MQATQKKIRILNVHFSIEKTSIEITRLVIVPEKPSKRRPNIEPNQTGFFYSHSNNKCSTVSREEWHMRHVREGVQLRLNKASRVARAFEQAFQKKFLVFGIVFENQFCFENPPVGLLDEDASLVPFLRQVSP